MKKKTCRLLLMSILLILLTACSKDSMADGNNIKILCSYSPQAGNPFRDILAEGIVNYAESKGATVDIVNPDFSIEAQVKQFEKAAAEGYQAIICIPENPGTARQLMAAADNLPIVFINAAPREEVLKEDKYVYVGSDEKVAGQYQAEYILNRFKSSDEINVMILKGERGHSGTLGRSNAVKETFAANNRKVNIVFEDYADWDTQKAKELFNIFLMTGQKVDAVFCNNDAMALGVIKAFKENNIDTQEVPILGIDATMEGCEAIKNGDMQFTVFQSAAGQGEYAARAAIALANGESIKEIDYADSDGKHIWVPFEQVTKDNVSNYMK